MNSAVETVLSFASADATLIGVLALPPSEVPMAATGVIIVVGGPQYRAGSHRQFVLLARNLAAAGHPVLRFDYRGMGDSPGEAQDFSGASADIGAALDALQAAQPSVKRWVLWGLCDGASAALLYLHDRADTRVSGLCLLNPWARSTSSLAKTHLKHHYSQRLREKEFWLKLLRGGIAKKALVDLLGNLSAVWRAPQKQVGSFQDRMAEAWLRFPGKILLILSGSDYTAKEFDDHANTSPAWGGAFTRAGVTRIDIDGADHTFSDREHAAAAEAHTRLFLAQSLSAAS